ncbi:hypothetical protein C9374_011551 [Naegleria lovaniensis]|uniref:Uncharacterized protein n=1 Tax=Naegleria lovaniensis TaxID=51637 RepID=A0AA88KQW6_NAELO|nr:uncharacterized protein C9374_011551 [Naegleria lovaniensis]KAG2392826.1 hypothetical protein C9374_011551 [Naegleria lovaniensis]
MVVLLHLQDFQNANPSPNTNILHSLLQYALSQPPPSLKHELFSNQFELQHTIGRVGWNGPISEYELHNPRDIKISYRHECIIVIETCRVNVLLIRLAFFDLNSKKFLGVFDSPRTGYLNYLCVEENYNELQQDALIFGCFEKAGVYKYDLHTIMKYCLHSIPFKNEVKDVQGEENVVSPSLDHEYFEKPKCQYLWHVTDPIRHPCGIAVCEQEKNKHSSSMNHVYVCDSDACCIHILNSRNGSYISKLDISNMDPTVSISGDQKMHPFGIAFAMDHVTGNQTLFVSCNPAQIQIFEKRRKIPSIRDECLNCFKNHKQEEWMFVKQVGQSGTQNGAFNDPNALAVICSNQEFLIYVSDFRNHRIQVFSWKGNRNVKDTTIPLMSSDWEHVKSFGTCGRGQRHCLYFPFSLCLNKNSGELLVTDSSNSRIQFFK